MDFSMRGKLMTRMPKIHRIFCMRCGKYQAHFLDPCVCLPLWTCMDDFQAKLCREQQCVYCVGATEWRPKRYPRIFNVKRYPFPAAKNIRVYSS